ncbi:hypothetical protein HOY82DRAFT_644362 [Tuber indicum]|nr:hypothetical protein HOY82DRAFT_644362 [Tuber indicum]
MAHDLPPINDGEKVTYVVKVTTSGGVDKGKETHMGDAIEWLMEDFEKFLGDNRNFVDMFSLPQHQGQKDIYSLHLAMAQECTGIFKKKTLPDMALVEQALRTGFDENRYPIKDLSESLVHDDAVALRMDFG